MNTNILKQNRKQRVTSGNVPPRGNILSIFGDDQFVVGLESALTSRGFTIVRARHAMHGVWLAITGSPDAIITDQVRPWDESNYLLDCLKRNPNTAIVPVVSMIDSLKQTKASVSRLSEVAACYLKSSPINELIEELDRQVALKATRVTAPAMRSDISRFDAFFEELGHSSPKTPWAVDSFFRSRMYWNQHRLSFHPVSKWTLHMANQLPVQRKALRRA